jgi:hypothetical protein
MNRENPQCLRCCGISSEGPGRGSLRRALARTPWPASSQFMATSQRATRLSSSLRARCFMTSRSFGPGEPATAAYTTTTCLASALVTSPSFIVWWRVEAVSSPTRGQTRGVPHAVGEPVGVSDEAVSGPASGQILPPSDSSLDKPVGPYADWDYCAGRRLAGRSAYQAALLGYAPRSGTPSVRPSASRTS